MTPRFGLLKFPFPVLIHSWMYSYTYPIDALILNIAPDIQAFLLLATGTSRA